jgi:hypothetical protein
MAVLLDGAMSPVDSDEGRTDCQNSNLHTLGSGGLDFWAFLGDLDVETLLTTTSSADRACCGLEPSATNAVASSSTLALAASEHCEHVQESSSSWTSDACSSHALITSPSVNSRTVEARERLQQQQDHDTSPILNLETYHRRNTVSRTMGEGEARKRSKTPRSLSRCQVESCGAPLADAKSYYRRRRLCRDCILAEHVVTQGKSMRFCQQCSNLHEITAFDGAKRSCRAKLARHKLRARRVRKQS